MSCFSSSSETRSINYKAKIQQILLEYIRSYLYTKITSDIAQCFYKCLYNEYLHISPMELHFYKRSTSTNVIKYSYIEQERNWDTKFNVMRH